MSNPAPVLSVRINARERQLLEIAAGQSNTSLSDFVRRKAVEAAEMEMMSHGLLTIPAADWKRFEAWADSPSKDVPALRELAKHRRAARD